jgi:hypothetical protein
VSEAVLFIEIVLGCVAFVFLFAGAVYIWTGKKIIPWLPTEGKSHDH